MRVTLMSLPRLSAPLPAITPATCVPWPYASFVSLSPSMKLSLYTTRLFFWSLPPPLRSSPASIPLSMTAIPIPTPSWPRFHAKSAPMTDTALSKVERKVRSLEMNSISGSFARRSNWPAGMRKEAAFTCVLVNVEWRARRFPVGEYTVISAAQFGRERRCSGASGPRQV